MKNKLIFIFLDGIGLGRNDGTNPFSKAAMPTLIGLMEGKLVNTPNIQKQNLLVKGIDACLGMAGIPQSATGQTALFTGYNAPAILGYHLMAYPNDELINVINKRSIFKYARENGIDSVFANSYSDGFFNGFDLSSPSYSVTTRCVLAGQGKFHTLDDLKENNAVHWDITNSTLQTMANNRVPLFTSFQAGQNLRNKAMKHDLVLFECFLPDMIGHKMDMQQSISFLEMLDDFLRGVITGMPAHMNVVISSDHGNMEDLSTGSHTKNPVPLIVIGNLAPRFEKVNAIDEIFHAIFSRVFHVPGEKVWNKV